MAEIAITPTQLTLATTRTHEMVQFYTTVFALDLQPVSSYGTTLYKGMLHDATFVLCPNALAGVQADQSRHQFTYTVSDLAALVQRTIAAGGTVQQEVAASDRPATTTVRDPDGNSIVFIQAAEPTA